jgi:hypothetical protein
LTFLDVGLELRSPLPYLTWDSARKQNPGTLGKMPTGVSNLRGSNPARRVLGEVRNRAITLRL